MIFHSYVSWPEGIFGHFWVVNVGIGKTFHTWSICMHKRIIEPSRFELPKPEIIATCHTWIFWTTWQQSKQAKPCCFVTLVQITWHRSNIFQIWKTNLAKYIYCLLAQETDTEGIQLYNWPCAHTLQHITTLYPNKKGTNHLNKSLHIASACPSSIGSFPLLCFLKNEHYGARWSLVWVIIQFRVYIKPIVVF